MRKLQCFQAEPSTDDDCDSDSKHSQSYRERRREAHTAAEQKRRDAIKKGYDTLQELVPTCTQVGTCWISLCQQNMINLSPLTDWCFGSQSKQGCCAAEVHRLHPASLKTEKVTREWSDELKKRGRYRATKSCIKTCFQVVALQIMRANYEQLVRAHMRAPQIPENLVADETKFQVGRFPTWRRSKNFDKQFQVFQVFMDSLFQSFNQQVSMNNFAELSGCVFSWIEERCKPGDLQVQWIQDTAWIPNYQIS